MKVAEVPSEQMLRERVAAERCRLERQWRDGDVEHYYGYHCRIPLELRGYEMGFLAAAEMVLDDPESALAVLARLGARPVMRDGRPDWPDDHVHPPGLEWFSPRKVA